ncbi:MAG: hypothetical protein SNH63_02820 [Rikenellaceae bacterium]
MAKKNQAPTAPRQSAGARSLAHYKDTKISLSPLQNALFILLADGRRYSSHKIMQLIHTSDPRKEVQYLRHKGINVQDIWVEADREISRHKLYFIDPKECS